MKNKFKVGDRVESTADNYKGLQGVIKIMDDSKYPYYVKFDNGAECWKFIESVKLIQPAMKNIKDLGEKVAIQCKTQEEWDWVTKELGYKWRGACWYDYKENTGINAGDKGMSRISWYVDEGYTIVQASEFMPLSPQDEIKELKARIATLEELYRPKKKIEVLKLITETFEITNSVDDSCDYDNVELVCKYTNFDIIKAWDNGDDPIIFLGHFNDGEK